MIKRTLQQGLLQALEEFPAVTLIGPRQVGKTTLSQQVAQQMTATVFDLENPRHRMVLEDPLASLEDLSDQLVIIDEAQRMGDLFPVLRVLIDQDRRPGRFLLLGSAAPNLRRQSAESLAGRLQTLQLYPLRLAEVDEQSQDKLWLRGGLPPAFLAESNHKAMTWRQAYLRDLVERDLRLLGFDLSPERMRRFILMLAHLHGQLWNASQLARSLGIGATTAGRYLDIIQQTLLVRRINPYYRNLGKRLTKSPKVYLADSGLLHALLGISDKLELFAHPVAGASWEGFVLQQIAAQLPDSWETSFWRTAAGAEIDLLLLKNGEPQIAVEIKLNSSKPKPRRGFYQACDDLQIEQRWVVYPGSEIFLLSQEVQILPLPEALRRLEEQTGTTANGI